MSESEDEPGADDDLVTEQGVNEGVQELEEEAGADAGAGRDEDEQEPSGR